MSDRLQSIGRNLRHNVDLYATLAVCMVVAALTIVGSVGDRWINPAILLTLMLLAVGSLRDRADENTLRDKLDKLKSKSSDEGNVRWYTRRSEATVDMLADMGRFPHLVFLGVSHRHLPSYLGDKLQHANGPLPWETVEVYFGSDLLGNVYESKNFGSHIRDVRQELAMLLTDPNYSERIPHLRSIDFFQQEGLTSSTGAMFGKSPRDLSVIYAVHSAVCLHGDTHEGLTIRLCVDAGGQGFGDARFDHYSGIYRMLCQSPRRLGTFARSTWDRSALAWASYARKSHVELRSIEFAASMTPTATGDSILDIGSGSGDAVEVIVQCNPDASIVLLDGSPQMVRLLRDRYGNETRVGIALCQLPASDWEDIDIRKERFSVIIIHESFGDLIKAFGSIDSLAEWCRSRLRPDGRVLVAAHNTLVGTQPPNGFEEWRDPFRAKLRKKLHDTGRTRPHLKGQQKPLAQEAVEGAFEGHGFTLKEKRQEVIKLDYEDRRRMWHVPAVMDSMIHVDEVWDNRFPAFVDEIVEQLRSQQTMPRTQVCWLFTLTTEETLSKDDRGASSN